MLLILIETIASNRVTELAALQTLMDAVTAPDHLRGRSLCPQGLRGANPAPPRR